MTTTATQITAEMERRLALFADHMETAIKTGGAMLEHEMRQRAGLTDHDLKALEQIGHPYRTRGGGYGKATKAGKWRAGIKKVARLEREGTLGHDIKLVHVQNESSPTLQDSIYNLFERTEAYLWAKVGVDAGKFPIIEYIVKGTSKMIPRDFIGLAAVAKRREIMALMRTSINAAARAVGVR